MFWIFIAAVSGSALALAIQSSCNAVLSKALGTDRCGPGVILHRVVQITFFLVRSELHCYLLTVTLIRRG